MKLRMFSLAVVSVVVASLGSTWAISAADEERAPDGRQVDHSIGVAVYNERGESLGERRGVGQIALMFSPQVRLAEDQAPEEFELRVTVWSLSDGKVLINKSYGSFQAQPGEDIQPNADGIGEHGDTFRQPMPPGRYKVMVGLWQIHEDPQEYSLRDAFDATSTKGELARLERPEGEGNLMAFNRFTYTVE